MKRQHCDHCKGTGRVSLRYWSPQNRWSHWGDRQCPQCQGTGTAVKEDPALLVQSIPVGVAFEGVC